jgi:energy-coupling factor transporter transmembrane protein EcfT
MSSFKQIFRLYAYPVLFLFIGCLTIAVSFRENMDYPLFSNPHVGFSKSDLALAINIFFRSMAVLSIVLFGILTFSISEIATLMHSIRVPGLFIELFILTYKFIFNLASATKNMYTAQKLRLAYQKPGDVRSFSMLMAATFRRAFDQSTNLSIAIDTRLGTGSFHFVSQRKQFEMHQLYGPSVFAVLLTLIFIFFQLHG